MSDDTSRMNPYVGPRTFGRQEANFFFGRDAEARELLARVISDRLMLFHAQSGAGKSSLINTRLIPALENEGFEVLPVGRVSGELPRSIDPAQVENIFVFNLLRNLDYGESDPAELLGVSLSDYLRADREDNPETGEIHVRALIIDQFEEILSTHNERWRDRKPFFHQLRQAMEDDPDLWVILSMREDYVGGLDAFARQLPGRLQSRFNMTRMRAPAAIEAVEQPAKVAGRPFAPGVAERLVDDLRQIRSPGQEDVFVAGEYVEPVQLQVACFQLWENLRQLPGDIPVITEEHVQQSGDVNQALTMFYEAAISQTVKATDISQRVLREWFDKQLITEAGTRSIVRKGEQETAGLPNRAVDVLVDLRLLRTELRAQDVWVELVHDRFVQPIQNSNLIFRTGYHNPVAAAFQQWQEGDRDDQLLLDFGALREAREFMADNPGEVRAEEQAFMEKSEAFRKEERAKTTRQGKIALAVAVVILVLLCALAVVITMLLTN